MLLVAIKEAADGDKTGVISKWLLSDSHEAFTSNFVISNIISDTYDLAMVKKKLVSMLFSENLVSMKKRYKLENLLIQIRKVTG
jgi:hypothetical protein